MSASHQHCEQSQAAKELFSRIDEDIHCRVAGGIQTLARKLVGEHNVLALLFYGSGLWGQAQEDTIYDFYILLDDLKDWPGTSFTRKANALLPPNVEYHEVKVGDIVLRAKVAIMTYEQFYGAASLLSFDTTIWARFSQPTRMLYCRDDRTRLKIVKALARCVVTSAIWAGLLGSAHEDLLEIYNNLYRKTYRAELRVEKKGRSKSIVSVAPERYVTMLRLAWQAISLPLPSQADTWPDHFPSSCARHVAQKRWRVITMWGSVLNFIRLMKATYTFQNGAEYILWKIERHTGVKFELTNFRKKHPIVASIPILFYLWKNKIIRHN